MTLSKYLKSVSLIFCIFAKHAMMRPNLKSGFST